MHVLVAEDDTQVLAIVANCLSKWGYVVTAVRDGDSALKAFEQNPDIKLVVMNWMLPGADGIAVSREMKSRREAVQTIVVVGGRFCAEIRDAFRSWADHFVSRSLLLNILQALSAPAGSAAPSERIPVRTATLASVGIGRRRIDCRGAPMRSLGARWN